MATKKKPAAKAAVEETRPAPGVGEMGRQSIDVASYAPRRDPEAPGPAPVASPMEQAAPAGDRTSVRVEDFRVYAEIKDPKKGLEPHEAYTLYKQLGAACMEVS